MSKNNNENIKETTKKKKKIQNSSSIEIFQNIHISGHYGKT